MANIRLELPSSADIVESMLNRTRSIEYEILLAADTIELSVAPPAPGFDPSQHWRQVQGHLRDFMEWWDSERRKNAQLIIFLDVWWTFVAECNGLPTFQMLSGWVVQKAQDAWIMLRYDPYGGL